MLGSGWEDQAIRRSTATQIVCQNPNQVDLAFIVTADVVLTLSAARFSGRVISVTYLVRVLIIRKGTWESASTDMDIHYRKTGESSGKAIVYNVMVLGSF